MLTIQPAPVPPEHLCRALHGVGLSPMRPRVPGSVWAAAEEVMRAGRKYTLCPGCELDSQELQNTSVA